MSYPSARDIVNTIMRNRAGWYHYLPGALDRVMTRINRSMVSEKYFVDFLELAIFDEEFAARAAIENLPRSGWAQWSRQVLREGGHIQ